MKTFLLICAGCLIAVLSQAQIIHVPGDYPSIQQGINAATNGDTVLVSDGLYYEQINFLGKAITVASNFLVTGDPEDIENTIIDGSQIPDGDSCSVVYFINDEDTTSVLTGFTIQHGKGTYHTYANETFNSGGAIFIHTAGAKIIHNHITENHLNDTISGNPKYVDAAGIAIYGNTDKWVVVDHNQIDHNSCYASQADAARTAGIWVYDHNCLITNNNISSDTCIAEGNSKALAGAFLCYSPLVNVYSAIIRSNVFRNNMVQSSDYAAAACGATQNYIIKFSGNLVENNKSEGNSQANWDGGIFEIIDPGPGSYIAGNTFRGNTTYRLAGALNLMLLSAQRDHETVIVENNYFLENESLSGGGFHSRDVPVLLQNNVFSGNYATNYGGAISFQKYWPSNNPHLLTLINNSFSGNETGGYGGAIYSSSGDPLIINSIFWNNNADDLGDEIFLQVNDTAEIAFTDIDTTKIEGDGIWYDGGGNINEDPLFIDQDLLIPDDESPCIDAGIDAFTCACGVTHFCPEYDILDTIRPLGGFDMGAYEWYPGVGIPSYENNNLKADIYPNPTNGIVKCQFSIPDSRFVSISIYDHIGREVRMVVNEQLEAGEHKIRFDVSGLPAGIYFLKLTVGSRQSAVGKIIKL